MTRALLQQALEPMDSCWSSSFSPQQHHDEELIASAKNAIRNELAKPEQQERKPIVENIRLAQIVAGEDAVISDLRKKGLIP